MEIISGIIPVASEITYVDADMRKRQPTEIEALTALLFDTVYAQGIQFGAELTSLHFQTIYPIVLGDSHKISRLFDPLYAKPIMRSLHFSISFVKETQDFMRMVETDQSGEAYIGNERVTLKQSKILRNTIIELLRQQNKRI